MEKLDIRVVFNSKGNEIFGTAINKAQGELIILDGNGRKAIIKVRKI